MSEPAESLLDRLGAIGRVETDTDTEKLRKRFLVYMGTFMSGGGLLWGSLAAWKGLLLPAIVPFGYTAMTIVNLTFFSLTKRFAPVRFVQILMSLLLPFLFQWIIGGWVSSGTVMIWAMLAIVGAMTFSEARQVVGWLVLYGVLCIVSALVDEQVATTFRIGVSGGTSTMFWAINLVVVSSLVFGLMIYLGFEREKVTRALEAANEKIVGMNERLEDEVAARTRELRSAAAQSRAILDNMADGMTAITREGVVSKRRTRRCRRCSSPTSRSSAGRPRTRFPRCSSTSPASRSRPMRSRGRICRSPVIAPGRRWRRRFTPTRSASARSSSCATSPSKKRSIA
jgi:hypothetical protein